MARKKTCFVVIGFGTKTDLSTGRQLDLDKTYENLIKPAMNSLGYECFRAKEIPHSGLIDKQMYEWIYKADIVIADISTLNPNALYELGVRHALRPHKTIVISEKELKYPFDLNHTLIEPYEHLGTDIGVSESKRFKSLLKKKVVAVEKSDKADSPVYTYLPNLIPPKFTTKEIRKISASLTIKPSIATLIRDGDEQMNKGNYKQAIMSFDAALIYDVNNTTLLQKKTLATYKSELPNRKTSLIAALRVIKQLSPETSTDPETLGLTGAIHKRLYEETKIKSHLNSSMKFYEKGFIIKNDYYNGLNLAYLYLLRAFDAKTINEKITDYTMAKRIYADVILICQKLLGKRKHTDRSDSVWIYQSIAHACLALGQATKFKKYSQLATARSKGRFDNETFDLHNKKVKLMLKEIKTKI